MIKHSITFAVTFVFSVGKRSCQVTWNQTTDVIWCDVMSRHPMSCQVCHDMISISCHVSSLYIILYYFWLRLIASSHLLSGRDVVLNVSFLLQVLELLQRCITTPLCKRPSSMQHLKNTMCWFCQPSQRRHQFSRRKSPLRYHFITLISKMIY